MTEIWLRDTLEHATEIPGHISLDLEAITAEGAPSRQRRGRRRAGGAVSAVLCVAAVTVGALTLTAGPHATVLKVAGAPSTQASPAADPDCADPGSKVPGLYLDWPCASAADASTPSLVRLAEQEVLGAHPDVKDPQVRLLADTRTSTDPDSGPSVTVVEVWDGAGSGPVVLAYVTGKVGHVTDASGGSGPPTTGGDPAFGAFGIFTTDNGVFRKMLFARADVTSITLEHDGAMTPAVVTGGVTSITVKAGDPSIMHPTWKYVAKDASGATVGMAPFDYSYFDACDGKVSSTCTPIGTATAPAATGSSSGSPTEAPVAAATQTAIPSPTPAPTDATQIPSVSPTP